MNTEVHVDTGIVAWAAAGKAFDQMFKSKPIIIISVT